MYFIHTRSIYEYILRLCSLRSCGFRVDTQEAFPSCGCLDYDLESGGDYLEVMNSLDLVETILEPFDESTTREVVSIICSAPMAEGDQLQVRI